MYQCVYEGIPKALFSSKQGLTPNHSLSTFTVQNLYIIIIYFFNVYVLVLSHSCPRM